MQSIELNLSNAQLGKLRRKLAVQIKPSQVGHGTPIHLGEPNFKKLVKAYNSDKSVRITLNSQEAEMSGGSLKSFTRGVKKTFKDPNLGRKISNTSRKIKNSYNQFDFVGDMDIPYVSQAYKLGQVAVNNGDALTQAGVEINNARLYGDKEDREQARNKFLTEFGKAQMSMGGTKGGSLKSFTRGVKKTFKDPNLGRKISNTSRKIKNSYNQFEVIGDLGIPYVSDAYNLGHIAVNNGDALTQAGVQMNNARLYGDENDKEQAKANFITTFGKAQTGMQGMKGSGANPYVPRSMRKTVNGGSFKVSGGSFKVSGQGFRPTTDESNFVGPNHPSFNAPKPDSYSGNGMKHKKCHCCGK